MRYNAVVRIQKFWRKIRREFVQNRMEFRSMQIQQRVDDINNFDQIDDQLDPVSIIIPLTQNSKIGNTFVDKNNMILDQYQKDKLLGLFKGWKTRRILRNQHLKGLKNEVGFMLKHKQNDLNSDELKHCKAEFIRISRKFCDIFQRLWKNHEWIKKYNINRGREISNTRSPRDFHSPIKKLFNPVFEQSKPKVEVNKNKTLGPNKVPLLSNPVPNLANLANKAIIDNKKTKDDRVVPPARINMFAEMENKNTNDKKRDYSTPNMKIGNNLASINRQYAMQTLDPPFKIQSDGFTEAVYTQEYKQQNNQQWPQSQSVPHPHQIPLHQMPQGQPQYMSPVYPGYAQYPNYQVSYGYQPPIGMTQTYYPQMYPYHQVVPGHIPGQSQPIYIMYSHPPPTENMGVAEGPSISTEPMQRPIPLKTPEKLDAKTIPILSELEIISKPEIKKMKSVKHQGNF